MERRNQQQAVVDPTPTSPPPFDWDPQPIPGAIILAHRLHGRWQDQNPISSLSPISTVHVVTSDVAGPSNTKPIDKGKAKIGDWAMTAAPMSPDNLPSPFVEDMQLAISLSLAEMIDQPTLLDSTSLMPPSLFETQVEQLRQLASVSNPALLQAILAHQEVLLDSNLFEPNPQAAPQLISPLYNPDPSQIPLLFPPAPPVISHHIPKPSLPLEPHLPSVHIPPLGSLSHLAHQFQELRLRK